MSTFAETPFFFFVDNAHPFFPINVGNDVRKIVELSDVACDARNSGTTLFKNTNPSISTRAYSSVHKDENRDKNVKTQVNSWKKDKRSRGHLKDQSNIQDMFFSEVKVQSNYQPHTTELRQTPIMYSSYGTSIPTSKRKFANEKFDRNRMQSVKNSTWRYSWTYDRDGRYEEDVLNSEEDPYVENSLRYTSMTENRLPHSQRQSIYSSRYSTRKPPFSFNGCNTCSSPKRHRDQWQPNDLTFSNRLFNLSQRPCQEHRAYLNEYLDGNDYSSEKSDDALRDYATRKRRIRSRTYSPPIDRYKCHQSVMQSPYGAVDQANIDEEDSSLFNDYGYLDADDDFLPVRADHVCPGEQVVRDSGNKSEKFIDRAVDRDSISNMSKASRCTDFSFDTLRTIGSKSSMRGRRKNYHKRGHDEREHQECDFCEFTPSTDEDRRKKVMRTTDAKIRNNDDSRARESKRLGRSSYDSTKDCDHRVLSDGKCTVDLEKCKSTVDSDEDTGNSLISGTTSTATNTEPIKIEQDNGEAVESIIPNVSYPEKRPITEKVSVATSDKSRQKTLNETASKSAGRFSRTAKRPSNDTTDSRVTRKKIAKPPVIPSAQDRTKSRSNLVKSTKAYLERKFAKSKPTSEVTSTERNNPEVKTEVTSAERNNHDTKNRPQSSGGLTQSKLPVRIGGRIKNRDSATSERASEQQDTPVEKINDNTNTENGSSEDTSQPKATSNVLQVSETVQTEFIDQPTSQVEPVLQIKEEPQDDSMSKPKPVSLENKPLSPKALPRTLNNLPRRGSIVKTRVKRETRYSSVIEKAK